MNLISILDYSTLIILIFLSLSRCQDKYIISPNSCPGYHQFLPDTMENNIMQFEIQCSNLKSPPQILIGIINFDWKEFISNENEFNLYSQNVNSNSAKIYLSTTSLSSNNMDQMEIKYFAFNSEEMYVQKFKIDEQDISSMIQNGEIKQKRKQINYILQKKSNTKRQIKCFLIGFRLVFSTPSQQQVDEKQSIFVETVAEFNENQFELIFTTLIQNNLKWVNINCIEFYEYDQNFLPKEYIQFISENKQSYSSIQNPNSYLPDQKQLDIKSQITDTQLHVGSLFYGFNGIDSYVYAGARIQYDDQQLFSYRAYGKVRSLTCDFLFLKIENCPNNCERCSNINACQICKFNFFQENGKCLDCIINCKYCTSNQNCLACKDQYFLYKGQCVLNQPKSTYCVSRTIYPF